MTYCIINNQKYRYDKTGLFSEIVDGKIFATTKVIAVNCLTGELEIFDPQVVKIIMIPYDERQTNRSR